MIFLGIRDPNIFLGSLNKLLPQLLFEFRVLPVNLDIFQVLVQLQLIELLFLEFFEGVLNGNLWSQLFKSFKIWLLLVCHLHK